LSLPSDILGPKELILVSCCNLGGFGARYSLGLVTREGVAWLNLDEVIDPSADKGIAGLLEARGGCFLALQGDRPRIVRLDRELEPAAQIDLPRAVDLHSLAERDGVLYVASSGRNEILAIDCPDGRFVGEARVHVRVASARKDVVHLNSVCFAGDALLYSMFGIRHAEVRGGALVNASTGAVVRGGIRDPHSAVDCGDGLVAYCESLTSSFCLLETATGALRHTRLTGYTRGASFTGRHFVVGSSRWRHRSRSLGSLREEPLSQDRHGNPWQRSALYFLNPDLSVAHRLDFTRYAPEIYDIAYVADRFAPASVFADAAARRLDAMYDEIHRQSRPVKSYYSQRA
jgi:Domain of unknown function (DUF4915)